MNTTFSLVIAVAALLAARDTPPTQNATDGFAQVLLLDNEHVLRGSIHRQDDQYIVAGPIGEVKVPASKALTVCPTIQDAYKFLQSRTNQRDGTERLRLARWCFTNWLDDQARAEAKAALQLGAAAVETKQLLTLLERRTASSCPPAAIAEVPTPPIDASPLDVSADCLALFTAKVQPILLNTCASCHATGRGGDFVLTRPSGNATRRATQINLAAAIQQINFDQPAASPLLSKACRPHGAQANAALTNRLAPLFATLKEWVELGAAQNPNVKSHGTTIVAVDMLPPPAVKQAPPPTATFPSTGEAAVLAAPPVARAVTRYPSPTPSQATDASGSVRSLPTTQAPPPTSPYDPALFNSKG